jgi:hypothetical protein
MPDGGFVTIHTDITDLAPRRPAALAEKSRQMDVLLDGDRPGHLDDGCRPELHRPEREVPGPAGYARQSWAMPARPSRPSSGTMHERGEYGDGAIDALGRRARGAGTGVPTHTDFERQRPRRDGHGNPRQSGARGGGFVTTYTDITERKQAEEAALRAHERELEEQVARFDAALSQHVARAVHVRQGLLKLVGLQ